jgi:hypothetical protein
MARAGVVAAIVVSFLVVVPTATAAPKKPDKWKPTVAVVTQEQDGIAPGEVAVVDAKCPNGYDVMGGSFVIEGGSLFAHAAGAAPIADRNLYRAIISNPRTNPFAGFPAVNAGAAVAAECAASGRPVVVDGRFGTPQRPGNDPYEIRGGNGGLGSTVFDRATRTTGIPNGEVATHATGCNSGSHSVFAGGYTIAGSLWAHALISAVLSKANDYSATIATPPSNPSLGVFAASTSLTVGVLCARDGRPIVLNEVGSGARAAAPPKKKGPPRRQGTVKIALKKVGGVASGTVKTVSAKCPSGYSIFGGSYLIGGNSVLTHATAAIVASKTNSFVVTAVNPPATINAGIPRTTAEVTAVATCARRATPIVVDGAFR